MGRELWYASIIANESDGCARLKSGTLTLTSPEPKWIGLPPPRGGLAPPPAEQSGSAQRRSGLQK
ncbi:MAG TPA: hypothetical protein VFV49_18450, partial [Thermoanaerobaculia bacterium]|nr:hypothetical protein [Thermoanaerobaculia bacterium]